MQAFDQWKDLGIDIYIYSSGSVPAQKLLFGYSDKGSSPAIQATHFCTGDLLPYIKGHFDTTTGLKVDKESYEKIAKAIYPDEEVTTSARKILFVTDSFAEAQASTAVSMQTALSIRPGNAPLPEEHGLAKEIHSFADLFQHFNFNK